MSILSVSLPAELDAFIEREIASGEFETKAQIVKKALRKFEEDLIVQRVLQAEQDVKEGKFFEGDLREIIKRTDV